MTQLCEGVAVGILGDSSPTCPFCEGKGPVELRGLHTKHGKLKSEQRLRENLASSSVVDSESVGAVMPIDGGNTPHEGWVVKAGVFEDFDVEIKAAPHHIIPGDAALAKSDLEKWTCASKGKIKEDIGYNVDGAPNGIFLPHLPHIHFTRHFEYLSADGQVKGETKTATKGKRKGQVVPKTFADIFGPWSKLPPARRNAIGYLVMNETWLQMHYTDHDDPYVHVDHDTNYDGEVKDRCNLLANLMPTYFAPRCPHAKSDDGKFNPPYGLVSRINGISAYFRTRMTGKPTNWQSWVSPLAQDFTAAAISGDVPLRVTFVITTK